MNVLGNLLGPHSALSSLCLLRAKEEEMGPRGIGRGQRFLISQAAAQLQLVQTAEFCMGWCQAGFDPVALDIASENEPHLSQMGILFSF